MFTGLVESVGELLERKETSGGFRLRVKSPLSPDLRQGDSIAVNGVCLTVILAEADQFHADVGYSNSIPKYMAWRENEVFEALALYDFGALAMNVGSGNPPQTVKALRVSSKFLSKMHAQKNQLVRWRR